MVESAGSLEFGQLLRQYRLAEELTQEQLAERSGLSVRAIQALERGRSRPQKDSVARLARAMGLSPEQQAQFDAAAPSAPRHRRMPVSTVAPHAASPESAGSPPARAVEAPAIDLPSVYSGDARNLPSPITSFVGRQRELVELLRLLATTRLVTLTGAGGTGKTRLAVEISQASRSTFPDGIAFVSLGALTDPDLVIPAIAQTFGVREVVGQSVGQTLLHVLREQEVLVVLDNFEHVVSAAPKVAELLASCPRLRILVTSREVLRLSGEHEYSVPPLAVPKVSEAGSKDRPCQYEAVQLFVERARAVKPDFDLTDESEQVVAEICRQLDGLPLAIELAAARIRLFSPRALLGRLDPRLALLTGGPRDLPPRQHTLRDTIAWSYDLLTASEQALFRRLGVFVGGCTLESAEQVIGATTALSSSDLIAGLDSLVSKSLLRQEEGIAGEPRFSMLETIREFALEQLDRAGESERLLGQHAIYFLAFAEEADQKLHSPERVASIARFTAELRNLGGALAWYRSTAGLAHSGAVEGLRLAVAVSRQCHGSGGPREGRQWLEGAMLAAESSESIVSTPTWTKALLLAGWLAWDEGDVEVGGSRIERSVTSLRSLGEQKWLARALNWRGYVALGRGDLGAAKADIEEALALHQALDDPWGIASSWSNLGEVARAAGDDARAAASYEESARWSRQVTDESHCAVTLSNLGYIRARQGQVARASALFRESIEISQKLHNDRVVGYALAGLGGVAVRAGDPRRGARLLAAAVNWFRRSRSLMQPPDRADFERDRAMVCSQLDEIAFAAAWTEGEAMTSEEAVAYAMEEALDAGAKTGGNA